MFLEALADVEGVSDVGADQNTKTIRFTAQDDKAAEAGIKALAKHGFFGKAKHGDKKLEFPSSGAKKGEKANTIVLHGVGYWIARGVGATDRLIEQLSDEAAWLAGIVDNLNTAPARAAGRARLETYRAFCRQAAQEYEGGDLETA